jgi:hypothetical protein
MRLGCLAIALTLWAAFASDSWGQSKRPPAKGQQDQTQSQEQKAATDQRGTEQFPLVVQPLPTKKTADIAKQEKRDADEKTSSDWWTWLLTLLTVVALFGQLAVFVAQAYFLKGTLKVTAIAAGAAKESADLAKNSLLIANRPIITVDPLILSGPTEVLNAPHIRFGLKNSGHGAAIIDRIDVTVETSLPRALTLQTNSGLVGSEINGTIEPHQSMSDLRVASEVLAVNELPNIWTGNVMLAVTFRITAHDILDNPYNQTFPFEFDPRERIFVRQGLAPEPRPRADK